MLSDEQIIGKAHEAGLYQDGINTQLPLWVLTQQELERFARAIEAEVRQQDSVLIQQLVDALDDLTEAGEDAWGEERPCVRFGKKAIITGRARLGEKT